MKIVLYLKDFLPYCLLILVLMLGQTALTLISPYITSNIINIGLQQKGFQDAYSPIYSTETYLKLCSVDQYATNILHVAYYYDETEHNYKIKENYSDKENLDNILIYPSAYVQNNNNIFTYSEFKNTLSEGHAKQNAILLVQQEMSSLGIDIFAIQFNYLLFQGSILLICALVLAILVYTCQIIIAYLATKIGKDKRDLYFDSLINFSFEEYKNFSEASLITRATNDINYITDYIKIFLNTVLVAPVSLCVGIVFAVITAPQMTWIIVLAGIAIIVAAKIAVKLTTPTFSKMQWLIDTIMLKSREIMSGQNVIRAFNNENFEEDRFNSSNEEFLHTSIFIGRLMSVITCLLSLGFNLVSILIVLIGGLYIKSGDLQVGNIFAFVNYSTIILVSISALGMFIGTMTRAKICMDRIEKVINTKPSIFSLQKRTINNIHSIKFKHVFYSYNNKSNELDNISFYANAGETLGIIGTLGSGKSTIANLILRILDVKKGEILVNDINIKNYDLHQYKNLIGFAPQNSFLFKGTIKENINFGNKTNNDPSKYIKITCLDSLIDSLEDGVDTVIDQQSQNISGGQQQRISIARALATNANILIFDDCFSALDYKVEKQILSNIENNFKEQIKIIISSRLSSIRNANKIIVLDEGKIVGFDTHKNLLKYCSEYLKIYKYQYSQETMKAI